MSLVSAADLRADDAAGRDALGRYTLSLVRSAEDPDFEIAYGLLDGEFGAKGELETRAAIEGYLRADPTHASAGQAGYWLVLARDERGEVAGVRDCHASVDSEGRFVVVFLSHVLVMPAFRGSGLGSVMRAVPASLGRAAAEGARMERPEIMLAAEMEPAVLGAADTLVRLIAYGRGGFSIIDPRALPYCQPDYREHRAIDLDRARPVPLLAVVRRLGREDEATIPKAMAAAFVEHLYRIVGSHCRASDLAAPRAHTLAALARTPGETVPLLRAPRTLDDRDAIDPLSRDVVLPYYPPSLIGPA